MMNELHQAATFSENQAPSRPACTAARTHTRTHLRPFERKIPANRMGRTGLEPVTLGLKVPCSTS
jgi:hypothetical protein